ncbi:MAG TPA: NAD-dependent epimerase/dehydratase [Candidatus Limnocylindrales bacterium]|nr:NAD-dependent epimerase/dehydratase [Candidatus Limnocylindrales bacterium]
MTSSRLLVLGAGGYLGSHVRAAIERLDREVVATYVSHRVPGKSTDGATWRRLDLGAADRQDLGGLIDAEEPDTVINCAGVTDGDALRQVRGNVVLVAELLAAVSAVRPGTRVVHLGSSAEYGSVAARVAIREDAKPNPVGTYGLTKLAATELVLAAGRAGQLDALVLRVFNPIGAGLPVGNLLTHAAMLMREAIASGSGQIHLGSLDAFRDFVDADDVADAVLAAALAPGPIGPRVLNVGSGRATQARDLVMLLARVAGFTGEVMEDAGASSRSADVPWQCADVGSIAELLAWRAERSLEASVRATWDAMSRGGP